MGIINFIVVLLFNLWWLKDGWQSFKDIYNGHHSKWISVFVWLYAAWGVFNLIYALK